MEEDPLSLQNDETLKHDASDRKHPHFFADILRIITGGKSHTSLAQDFVELLDEHDPESETLREEERGIFKNMFRAGGMTLNDIMVPRADITAVPDSADQAEILRVLIESEHTRIPIYKDNLDNITGFIHSKDVLKHVRPPAIFSCADLKREILYSPPSARIIDVLVRMRSERVHMCVVLDEYSATDGLVTMEDIIEEIVGEIRDEHDDGEEMSEWTRGKDGGYHMSARVSLSDVQELTGTQLIREEDEYDTVGGLIAHLAGKVPAKGETIRHPEGLVFTITEADPRRITKVYMHVE